MVCLDPSKSRKIASPRRGSSIVDSSWNPPRAPRRSNELITPLQRGDSRAPLSSVLRARRPAESRRKENGTEQPFRKHCTPFPDNADQPPRHWSRYSARIRFIYTWTITGARIISSFQTMTIRKSRGIYLLRPTRRCPKPFALLSATEQ